MDSLVGNMKKTRLRVGQIVPSSNTTMEIEVPAILGGHAGVTGVNFSFHSSRMRMKRVTKEELAAWEAEAYAKEVEMRKKHGLPPRQK